MLDLSKLVDKLLPDTDRYDHAQKCKKFMSLRFLVAFVSLLGCAVMYMTRVNINVAIVDMVTVVPKISVINTAFNQSVLSDECPVDSLNIDNTTIVGEFAWSPPTQGIVLGAFYYGYIWPQIFGGRLSELYGAKYMIGIAIFTSGVINLFTPFIIRWNYYLFIGSRVVLGLVQGILFPSFMVLMSKWIPPEEHSTFIPWLDVGCTIGTIVCSAGAGHLIENKVMGGWPSVFYICGVVAIVWCFLWFSVITSSPSSHSWITDTELNHILKRADNRRQHKTRNSIPWKRILTSKRFLSVLISKVLFGITWDFITSKIPAYFQDVIHFPISENGSIYSILMLGLAITSMSSGFVADMILETKWISKTNLAWEWLSH
ncbi:unnamed protein product [Medioppia subpectinata]|uniref:Major facilitator superfamily (MFS) profile domain-containing protein n=1 Tax=Medioppia subpectinata TaxID=1979941 RepID=A0A7R9L3S6_9ACAR|nr:unnamed protein product [Medioppia subpectinata]CAG2114887.1 unnamed protein product [Medioppia subpectinata]